MGSLRGAVCRGNLILEKRDCFAHIARNDIYWFSNDILGQGNLGGLFGKVNTYKIKTDGLVKLA